MKELVFFFVTKFFFLKREKVPEPVANRPQEAKPALVSRPYNQAALLVEQVNVF